MAKTEAQKKWERENKEKVAQQKKEYREKVRERHENAEEEKAIAEMDRVVAMEPGPERDRAAAKIPIAMMNLALEVQERHTEYIQKYGARNQKMLSNFERIAAKIGIEKARECTRLWNEEGEAAGDAFLKQAKAEAEVAQTGL